MIQVAQFAFYLTSWGEVCCSRFLCLVMSAWLENWRKLPAVLSSCPSAIHSHVIACPLGFRTPTWQQPTVLMCAYALARIAKVTSRSWTNNDSQKSMIAIQPLIVVVPAVLNISPWIFGSTASRIAFAALACTRLASVRFRITQSELWYDLW